MHGKTIHIVVAYADHQVIGYQNQLAWHIPADLRRFRALTWGHAVIMGRKTHQSIGRVLPGRQNIVLSHRPPAHPEADITWATDWDTAVRQAQTPDVFVIGGAAVYQLALPVADTLYITQIEGSFPGDTYFPAWDPAAFICVAREEPTDPGPIPYHYTHWIRRVDE